MAVQEAAEAPSTREIFNRQVTSVKGQKQEIGGECCRLMS